MTIRLPEATNNGRFTRSFVLKLLLVIATAFSLAKNGASRFTFVEYEESSYWFQPTTTTTTSSATLSPTVQKNVIVVAELKEALTGAKKVLLTKSSRDNVDHLLTQLTTVARAC